MYKLHLHWYYDIPRNHLSTTVNSELSYAAHRGGRDGYTKTYQGADSHVSYSDWPQEVDWIARTYPLLPRARTEFSSQELEKILALTPQHQGEILHGVSENGYILDRMGRESRLQSNYNEWLFTLVKLVPQGQVETADGVNYLLRLPAPLDAQFYNCMPCCVFPDNPGLRAVTQAEAAEWQLSSVSVTLKNRLEDTLKYFKLPN